MPPPPAPPRRQTPPSPKPEQAKAALSVACPMPPESPRVQRWGGGGDVAPAVPAPPKAAAKGGA
eukprot:8203867-Alexandrium_andersonii.AAC.1